MMSNETTRQILVTGGGRGIGAAIVARLRADGHQVDTPSRQELDLASMASIDAFLDRHRDDPIDVLVNNAGINILRSIEEIDDATWQEMMQVNLTAALRLTQAFAPGMAARGWGRILNVASIFAVVTRERRGAYSMTKASLAALTRTAAVEFGPRGVLVNALAPGYVDTELTRRNNPPEALKAIEDSIPLRRMARAEELAEVAAFLVSDRNTYLTGQTVLVDGGFTCQ
ncbi:MAG: SDR family NAD(P)-dependent oxidoreductase [Planctomycetia bacterium]